ncbi:MAG: hypothetical protein JO218_11610 [Burkholderiales bacterium]|nr:hypothetical protein [Burkholderiales bacterium]
MARPRIYLSITEAGVTAWTGAPVRLSSTRAFGADDAGMEEYIRYALANRQAVFCLLVDIPDEDCRLEQIPHVNARSRALVTKRRLNQLYRGSHYRTATLQGRESTGRRDDRILYTAITNAGSLERWLNPLVEHDIRIDGVYSTTLLMARHARSIAGIPPRALIVGRQFGSGLRQTYIADGSLRFSRLTSVEADDIAGLSAQLVAEAARARQFLASLRAIERTEVMHVTMLCSEDERPLFEAACSDSEFIHYQFLPLPEMARSLGVAGETTLTTAEPIWLRYIATHRPSNQYATEQQRKAYVAWRVGMGLLGAAALLLLGAMGVAAWYAKTSYQLRVEMAQLEQRRMAAEAVYAANVPATSGELTPTGMKNVVLAYRQLVEERPELSASLIRVSDVLGNFPMAELDELAWQLSTDPNAPLVDAGAQDTQAAAATAAPAAPAVDASGNPLPANQYVQLRIKGTLPDYDFRYRDALAVVGDMADAFAKLPGAKVEKLQLPIDVGPTGSVGLSTSELGDANKGAPFALKIVLPVPARAAPAVNPGGAS